MTPSDPNQAFRQRVGLSTAIISLGLILVGVGVSDPV